MVINPNRTTQHSIEKRGGSEVNEEIIPPDLDLIRGPLAHQVRVRGTHATPVGHSQLSTWSGLYEASGDYIILPCDALCGVEGLGLMKLRVHFELYF